jgi:hypothetical protein
LVFVDANENLVMANDVVMPSNFLVALVEKEEFEETLFDMNVSQRLCDEKPFEKMVHTRSIVRHGIIDYLLTHML